jgi:hypothetical protein
MGRGGLGLGAELSCALLIRAIIHVADAEGDCFDLE